jgi:ABC-type multidrug transport system fused ATPase/permease subunit
MYGSKVCTHARVEQAARLANAHDFISQLPQSYDAQVLLKFPAYFSH